MYKQQAIWFLNAFWVQGPKFGFNPEAAEEVWTFHKTCVELDREKKEEVRMVAMSEANQEMRVGW